MLIFNIYNFFQGSFISKILLFAFASFYFTKPSKHCQQPRIEAIAILLHLKPTISCTAIYQVYNNFKSVDFLTPQPPLTPSSPEHTKLLLTTKKGDTHLQHLSPPHCFLGPELTCPPLWLPTVTTTISNRRSQAFVLRSPCLHVFRP